MEVKTLAALQDKETSFWEKGKTKIKAARDNTVTALYRHGTIIEFSENTFLTREIQTQRLCHTNIISRMSGKGSGQEETNTNRKKKLPPAPSALWKTAA